jgi:hypothetical protein
MAAASLMSGISMQSAGLLKTPHFLRIEVRGLTAWARRAQSRRAGRKSRIGILHTLL